MQNKSNIKIKIATEFMLIFKIKIIIFKRFYSVQG